ncbi:hypothetical protein [Halolamina sp.]|jgi:hypothetical protein|uniref:hypothetical protein n=1 Tax=Halolamina sp. TaxID=1940283 RepID=UPI000223B47F|nr:hypothetical protein Halar_1590 [halophilic archaeon DL31]
MAARPPAGDGDDDTPETLAFGISALDARLSESELTFPATAAAVLDALEDPDIPYDTAGHTLALSEALAELQQTNFETETELKEALHPVYEEKRRSAGNSIVGQMRRLLPF